MVSFLNPWSFCLVLMNSDSSHVHFCGLNQIASHQLRGGIGQEYREFLEHLA